jgi:signal transduction histidine kinase
VAYLVFPALIWAAVRFGQRGATLAVAVAVGFTIWSTTHYEGPFVYHSITHTVLSTQLFVLVAAMSTLFLAAAVAEREAYAERLGASRAEFFRAADIERQRIERNLHDGAQQRLLALGVHLRLSAGSVRSEPERGPELFAEAEGELNDAIDELRELSQGIHPSLLTELGLADAIRSVAARSTIPVRIVDLPRTRVDVGAEAVAYYVISEAVVNAQKHARAATIVVAVSLGSDSLRLAVSDDGVGGADANGSGLRGLHERAESIGGALTVDSRAGAGTRIEAVLPATPRWSP